MINFKKPPIVLIASVAILAGGGALYLRIKPGPGKQINVSQPEKVSVVASPAEKENALTPAEQAAKRQFEWRLKDQNIIYRSPEYKEVENDGYEALVIASTEVRNEDKEWIRMVRAVEVGLVGNSWSTGDFSRHNDSNFFSIDQLRAWRDVKIEGVKEERLLPPEQLINGKDCGGTKTHVGAEALIGIENSSSVEREVEMLLSIAAGGLVKNLKEVCNVNRVFTDWNAVIKVPPNSKDTYPLVVETAESGCCLYSEILPGTNLDVLNIDGHKEPSKWWFEHPQYTP